MHDIEKNDADGSELLEDPVPHEPCFHPTHTKDWELSGEHLFFFLHHSTRHAIFFDGLGRLLNVD